MEFDFEAMAADARYRLLTSTIAPRPIAWVTSLSADGVRNAAPFSFFNAMGKDPPLLAIGIQGNADGTLKDTARNIEATGEFVVNLVTEDLAGAMNATSVPAAPDVDELRLAGLDTTASTRVRPPRIALAPVAFECRLHTPLAFASGQYIVIGEVLAAHIADGLVLDKDSQHLDQAALRPIARMPGRSRYLRATDTFDLKRPASLADIDRALPGSQK